MRFYASFDQMEVLEDGNILRSAYGDGATPEEAIEAYREEISRQTVIFDAMGSNRKKIYVPKLKLP